MVALDTNILVYAKRTEAPHHVAAKQLLQDLAEGGDPWGLPWPCVYEFLRVVTHPKVFDPPSDLEVVLEDLANLFQSPSIVLLGEGPHHAAHLRKLMSEGQVRGNLVHDAHIAAIALEHSVELLTVDKDFARFSSLRLRNPFDVGQRAQRKLP